MIARIPPLLVWLTAAIGAATVGLAALPVVQRFSADPAPLPRSLAARAADAPERPDLTAILDFAPFGRVADPEPRPDAPAPDREADLGLTLQGVTIAADRAASQAIIAGGDQPVGSYRIGAAITASASLAEVWPDHVVLNVAGQVRVLAFSDRAAEQSAAPYEDDIEAPASNGYLRTLIPAAADPDSAGRETLADLRADLQRNPSGLLAKYGIEPAGDGYLITEATPNGVLTIGLQPGDLVITLNGQALGDLATDQAWADQVAASGQIRLEVLRDGATLSLSSPLP